MIIHSLALLLFLQGPLVAQAQATSLRGLATTVTSNSCSKNLQLTFDETPCLARLAPEIQDTSCVGNNLRGRLHQAFKTIEEKCEWNYGYELRLITRTLSFEKASRVLDAVCQRAEAELWAKAPQSQWTDIDTKFTDAFMDEYTDGGTFLNLETGNFQNRDGSDPRLNEFYPTSEASYQAGVSIDAFYNNGATSSVLEKIPHLSHCQNQVMMCCFGRDRQYRDGNGDCMPRDCDNKPPGDNSNLCYSDETPPTAYPGDETIHCHGIAWAEDDADPSSILRYNNFFYVLMHDHMYSRGYVEPSVEGALMCGCIEDMNPVVRADCSEVRMKTDYSISFGANGLEVVPNPLDFKFRACRGITPDGTAVDNDLVSHVNQLVEDDKMSDATRETIFETLVGYANPNDNENEAACAMAWADVTQGAPYVAANDGA